MKLWLTLKPPASCMASQVIVIDAQEATILTWSCQYDVLERNMLLDPEKAADLKKWSHYRGG